MAPKRKPIEEVKSRVINVRITESDYRAMEEYQKLSGMALRSDITNVRNNVSEIVRLAIKNVVMAQN